MLETGATWSVKVKDTKSFERYMTQLKTYYFDLSSQLKESVYMKELMGLYLLYLLSENRIGEFHTELERLDLSLLPTGDGK
jgi:26S proteasome regulatory subunit N12